MTLYFECPFGWLRLRTSAKLVQILEHLLMGLRKCAIFACFLEPLQICEHWPQRDGGDMRVSCLGETPRRDSCWAGNNHGVISFHKVQRLFRINSNWTYVCTRTVVLPILYKVHLGKQCCGCFCAVATLLLQVQTPGSNESTTSEPELICGWLSALLTWYISLHVCTHVCWITGGLGAKQITFRLLPNIPGIAIDVVHLVSVLSWAVNFRKWSKQKRDPVFY